MSLLAAPQAQALLGAWQSIVGHNQQSGVPTQNYHGVYGGRPDRQFGGYPVPMPMPAFAPPFNPYGGFAYGAELAAAYGPAAFGGFQQYGVPQVAQVPVFQPPPPFNPYQAAVPYAIPPRNMLIDRPGPDRADRILLPMSSGVNILPNTSAQITSRPQNVAFRPERIIIGGDAGAWIVNDIKVGNRSQFSQSGDVPGETFASTAIDSFVSFETVQTAMDFVMLVTFIGASESGAAFVCSVLGTAAV